MDDPPDLLRIGEYVKQRWKVVSLNIYTLKHNYNISPLGCVYLFIHESCCIAIKLNMCLYQKKKVYFPLKQVEKKMTC